MHKKETIAHCLGGLGSRELTEKNNWGVSMSRDQKNKSGTGIILKVLCASLRPKE